ncbi:hypothetical protein [Amycolatopsis solani]|uniref:hypothetical protein n=1 Tax=Amycolatopsis solani TaxID=3028615 RepID=UPI00296E5D96|nr:hypothetical protein [Amycolatopsis sp. MEP2-6]
MTTWFDLVTMGRIGVDVHPRQTGVGLEDVTSFGKDAMPTEDQVVRKPGAHR